MFQFFSLVEEHSSEERLIGAMCSVLLLSNKFLSKRKLNLGIFRVHVVSDVFVRLTVMIEYFRDCTIKGINATEVIFRYK